MRINIDMDESSIISIINLLKDISNDMYDTYLFENARGNCHRCASLINKHITGLKPNEHAFVDEFLDTYSGILKKYIDYLISIDDRSIAKNHKPSIDAIFSAAWLIIINDESSCEHQCLDNLGECINALLIAYVKLQCGIHINDMYEQVKMSEYPHIVYRDLSRMCTISDYDIRTISNGNESLIDIISNHMKALKCKCKIIDRDSPDDDLYFWIRKYGYTRITFKWGISEL